MTSSPNDHRTAKGVRLQGLKRALDVVRVLADGPMRATTIAREVGMPWATLHRILSQLCDEGFLNKDEDNSLYSIGQSMWLLGTGYLARHTVLQTGLPDLKVLSNRLPYTNVQLAERAGRLAIVLFSSQQAGEIITKTTYGYHFPLHAGSKGQVLLAYSSDRDIEEFLDGPLERLTPETVTDPDRIHETIKLIREQGYALTAGDVQPFTGSVAAPVFGHPDRILAAVCVITQRSEIENPARTNELVEAVQHCARSLSLSLGWHPSRRMGRAGT